MQRLWGESMACRKVAELNTAGALSARSCVVEMEEVGKTGCGHTGTLVLTLALLLIRCVSLGKSLPFSVP